MTSVFFRECDECGAFINTLHDCPACGFYFCAGCMTSHSLCADCSEPRDDLDDFPDYDEED
jgi:hypothetical protein